MKPPAFEYFDPLTLPDAVRLLAEHGERAKVLAGGQSLMPLLNFRSLHPGALVDINGLEELHVLDEEQGRLTIGATARQRELEQFEGIREINPLLAEAVSLIGHFQIRNRGTVCGSLAYADPAAELPAVAVTQDAQFTLERRASRRVVPARRFFVAPFATALEPDEMLTHVSFPAWRAGDGWAIEEAARRHNDFALVGVMVVLTPSAGRICAASRITVFGTGEPPQRLTEVEEMLAGNSLSQKLLSMAVARVRVVTRAKGDIRATAFYRKQVAGNLTRRALLRAAARAGLSTE